MGKVLAALAIAAAALFSSGGPANADYCGASGNGCEQSMGNTDCAGHGSFGAPPMNQIGR